MIRNYNNAKIRLGTPVNHIGLQFEEQQMLTPSKQDIHDGQAIYTKKSLPIYDLLVTKFSNRFAWKCPRHILIQHFQNHISKNHLDIGVGTGYFLERANLLPSQQRLGLLDLNQDCLEHAAANLYQFQPEIYHHDAFEPFTSITRPFDSVSLNYVLHCLPGNLSQKAVAFDHIKAVLNPGGKLFGGTLLGKHIRRNWLAEKLTRLYNKKKIFCNVEDDYATLEMELKKRFDQVEIKMQGCVALFSAY